MITFATDDQKTPATIPTRIVSYYLAIDKPDSRAQYQAIKAERKAAGVKLFDCIDGDKWREYMPEDQIIHLETSFVFDNQWNTTDGRRVFDWYEKIFPNRDVKRGHYLEITPEMIALRENTFKCGYCGANYHGAHNAGAFCGACLDSEYLKVDNLPLLRVIPCASGWGNRPALTEREYSELFPLYVERQTISNGSRAVAKKAKIRRDVIASAKKDVRNANTEKRGFLWLLDHNINTENVIYYDHKSIFCIGWRTPVSFEIEQEFKRLLEGFPFEYEFKYA